MAALDQLAHLNANELTTKSKEQSEVKKDIDIKIVDIAKTEPDAGRSDMIKQVWTKFTNILRKSGVDMKQYQDWEIWQLFFAGMKKEKLQMINNDLAPNSLNHNNVLSALGNRIIAYKKESDANKQKEELKKEKWKDVWEWQVLDIKYAERLNQLTTAQSKLKTDDKYKDKLAEIKPDDTPKITALEAKYGMKEGELLKEFNRPNGKFDAYKKADPKFDFSQLLSFLQTNLVAKTDKTVNRLDFRDFEEKYAQMGLGIDPVMPLGGSPDPNTGQLSHAVDVADIRNLSDTAIVGPDAPTWLRDYAGIDAREMSPTFYAKLNDFKADKVLDSDFEKKTKSDFRQVWLPNLRITS